MSKLGDMLSTLVLLKRIAEGGLGAEPPVVGGYGSLGVMAKHPASEIFFSTMVLQIYYVTSAFYPYSALTLA